MRKFQRIPNQISQHRFQHVHVSAQAHPFRNLRAQRDAFLLSDGAEQADDVLTELAETHILRLEFDAALLNARPCQQIFQQFAEVLRRRCLQGDQLFQLVNVVEVKQFFSGLRQFIQRMHRPAQIMRDDGKKGVFGGVQFLQLPLLTPQQQMRMHPRQHFFVAQGLREIIHAARLKPVHNIVQIRKRGDENDRNVFRARIAFQAAAGFESVEARHQHVQQNQVGQKPLRDANRLFAALGNQNAQVGVVQVREQHVNIFRRIVHD